MKKIILNKVNKKSLHYKKHFALVDNEDYERVNKYNWRVIKRNHTIYAVSTFGRNNVRLHNFIMGFIGIDHKDGNGLNCQKSNLRKATQTENMRNRKSNKNSTSKFKGVSRHKKNRRWICSIGFDGETIYLGSFISELEAAKTYNNAAIKYQKEFARLNKIPKQK